MASVIGEALVLIRPELTKFGNELKEGVGAAVTKTEGESSSAFNKLAGVGKAAFLGIAAAAVGFGAEAIDAALKGQEATAQLANAVKQAGGNWDQLKGHVEEVTDGYAKFGITNDEAEAGLTRLVQITGDVGQSEKLLATAADLAAARHIDLTTAANLVGRAAEGNITPLKRMGIVVQDTGSSAGNAEAAIAALNQRFGGAAQAQADTYAGKLKAFKAETENLTEQVGNALLPVLAGMAGDLAGAVEFFEKNRTAAVALGVVVGGPLAAAMAAFVVQESILIAKRVAEFFVSAVEGAAQFAFALAGAADAVYVALGPFGILAAGATALAVALGRADDGAKKAGTTFAESFVKNAKDSSDEATVLRGKLNELADANIKLYNDQLKQVGGAKEVAQSYLQGNKQYEQNTAQIKVLRDELAKLETGQKANTDAVRVAKDAGVELQAQDEKTGSSLDDLAEATHLSTTRAQELADKLNLDLAKVALPEAAAKVSALSDTLSIGSAQSLQLRDALAKVADTTSTATDKASAFKTALDILIGGSIDAEKATVNFQASIDGLSGKLQGNKLSMDATTKAGRDNITAVEDSVAAIRNHVEALKNQGASADALRGAFDGDTTALRNQLTQAGFTKDQVDKLIASYGLVPSSLNTVIRADISDAEEQLRQYVRDLGAVGGAVVALPGVIPRHARGAYFPGGRPELAIVGESREVMLPLDDPARMAAILAEAGVGSGPATTAAAATAPASGTSVSVSIVMPGLATSPEAQALIRDVAQGEFTSAMTQVLDRAAAGTGSRGG